MNKNPISKDMPISSFAHVNSVFFYALHYLWLYWNKFSIPLLKATEPDLTCADSELLTVLVCLISLLVYLVGATQVQHVVCLMTFLIHSEAMFVEANSSRAGAWATRKALLDHIAVIVVSKSISSFPAVWEHPSCPKRSHPLTRHHHSVSLSYVFPITD